MALYFCLNLELNQVVIYHSIVIESPVKFSDNLELPRHPLRQYAYKKPHPDIERGMSPEKQAGRTNKPRTQ